MAFLVSGYLYPLTPSPKKIDRKLLFTLFYKKQQLSLLLHFSYVNETQDLCSQHYLWANTIAMLVFFGGEKFFLHCYD